MILSADPADWGLAAAIMLGWVALSLRALRAAGASDRVAGARLLIGYASQSGTAEALARAAARLRPGRILPLNRISATDLSEADEAHFYISTTGDGDPPDNAAGFAARVMAGRADLRGLRYAVLGLGDRRYPQFCAFARALEGWLQDAGGNPIAPLTELDRADLDRDPQTQIAPWQARLGLNTPIPDSPGAGQAVRLTEAAASWRLVSRRELNPGSPGAPLWHLRLVPEAALPDWQAGDIATLTIPTATGAIFRDYSIASLPGSGGVELILREVIRADGGRGQGSGWLARGLADGGCTELRIRQNPGFHAGTSARPMLLIGNGSGMAGLLAHLRQRAAQHPGQQATGAGPVWLFHGERSAEHDAIFAPELAGALASGTLHRLARSFSRSPGWPCYVQDLLRAEAEAIRRFIGAEGAIWICGRREGMAKDVMDALAEIFGPDVLSVMIAAGRVRCDVY